MKFSIYIFTIFFILLNSEAISQQTSLKISYGISNYIVTSNDKDVTIKPDFKRMKGQRSFLLDVTRSGIITNKLGYNYGGRISHNLGVIHPFYGKWVSSFFGIKLGASYKYLRLLFGINVVPSIRYLKSIGIASIDGGIGSGYKPIFNYEANPYIEFDIYKNKFSIVLDYSIGISNIYKIGVVNHRIHYSTIGLKYNFN